MFSKKMNPQIMAAMKNKYLRLKFKKIKLRLRANVNKRLAKSDEEPFKDYSQIKLDGNWAIETASFCNRNCPFCPGTIDEPVNKRRLIINNNQREKIKIRIPFKKILNLLDEIREITTAKSPTILPFVLNEPYEDERIISILKAIKEKGFTSYMVSNGDVFKKKPEIISESFPYLDRLKLGIYYNGTTREGKSNIKSKMTYFKKEYEILATKHRWRPQLEFSISSEGFSIPESFLQKGRSVKYPCYLNMDGFRQISAFGDLSICCKDNSWEELGGVCLGNIFEKNLHDIIFSPRHLEILNILCRGERHKLFRCATCVGGIGVPDLAEAPSYWKGKSSGQSPKDQLASLLDRLNEDSSISGSEFDFLSKDFTYKMEKGPEIWDDAEKCWKPT